MGAWYRHSYGLATLLHIAPGSVTNTSSVEVGAFPEGVAYSPDGDFVYVGNFADNSLTVLRVDPAGLSVVARIPLPGRPASLRLTR